jgi:hypothetical protein
MESWHGQTYDSIMSIPVTRRYRFMLRKSELEETRRRDHENAMARMRARRRG